MKLLPEEILMINGFITLDSISSCIESSLNSVKSGWTPKGCMMLTKEGWVEL